MVTVKAKHKLLQSAFKTYWLETFRQLPDTSRQNLRAKLTELKKTLVGIETVVKKNHTGTDDFFDMAESKKESRLTSET